MITPIFLTIPDSKQFLSVKSIKWKIPPILTIALHSVFVKFFNRDPSPPARIIVYNLFIFQSPF